MPPALICFKSNSTKQPPFAIVTVSLIGRRAHCVPPQAFDVGLELCTNLQLLPQLQIFDAAVSK
jgi:hypothetical protein